MMDWFTGQEGPTGTNSVRSKPDWCSRKVLGGHEAGKLFWARPVETLHKQDLGQRSRPDN